jgi:nitrite reductase/ring-hydroxylating ferredoxin subunit
MVMARDDASVGALLDRIREDARVTRRDYLRILVTVSGGLLVGSGVVAAGVFPRRTAHKAREKRITRSLARGQAVAFKYPSEHDPAIAMRLRSGEVVAYSSVCTHLSCAVLWHEATGDLRCPCHDGRFDARSGRVLAGPPPRPLPKIKVEERGDGIWAVGTLT